mgnify:FL=1
MSKKKLKKQNQRKRLPLPLMAIGGVLLILAAFFFAKQSAGGGTPVIAVDQQKIDYGDVKLDTEKTFTVKVTNTGKGTLRFKEEPYIEVLEGC